MLRCVHRKGNAHPWREAAEGASWSIPKRMCTRNAKPRSVHCIHHQVVGTQAAWCPLSTIPANDKFATCFELTSTSTEGGREDTQQRQLQCQLKSIRVSTSNNIAVIHEAPRPVIVFFWSQIRRVQAGNFGCVHSKWCCQHCTGGARGLCAQISLYAPHWLSRTGIARRLVSDSPCTRSDGFHVLVCSDVLCLLRIYEF